MEDLNDIVIFTRVAEAGSFTTAARQLDMPKSTVSRRVSGLEDRLGTRLLQRTTRKLSITDAGRLLLTYGMRILADLQEAEEAVHHMQAKPRGVLKITAPVDAGSILIPVLASFMRMYPEVEVDLNLTNRFVDLVAEGFDAAIRAGKLLGESQLKARKLNSSKPVMVASPTYLTQFGKPETCRDLEQHQCILFPRKEAEQIWKLRDENGPVEVRVKGVIGLNDMSAVKYAVLEGLGIGRLPESYCARELEEGRLVSVLDGALPNEGNIWLVYPGARYPSPKVKAFVDFLTHNFHL